MKWGSSPAEARAAFPGGTDMGGVWIVESEYAGVPAYLSMGFFRDMFFAVGINFHPKSTKKNDFLAVFENVERILIKEMGKPKARVRENRTELPNDLDAISIGEGIYRDEWETGESTVILTLTGHNYRYFLSLSFSCRSLLESKRKLEGGVYDY